MIRRDKIILLAIVVLAVIIRVLYLAEIHDDPLLHYTIKNDIFDQYRFMQPVTQIVNGNWLGPKTFYSLGYSYVISVLYLFLPKDITTVFAFQIILGIMAVYVAYRATALLFNNKIAGVIAAFIVALYSPFVFQECDIERGAIIAYSDLICFYLLLRALKKDRIKYFFFAGLVMGFSMIIRPNILPFFVAPYVFFAVKRSYKARIGSVMALVLGVMILSAPFAFRNMMMGQGFTIEPQGIEAFWVGNTYDSPGIGLVWLDSQKELTKESGNNIGKAFAILCREIKEYPQEYRQLYSRKIKMFLNGYEVPSNLNYYLFKERYLVLNICLFNFAIVSSLALTGILLARRKYRFIGLLYIFLFVLSFSNIAFHIQGRYRIPVVPFFIIMAAYTIYWLIDQARHKKWTLALYAVLTIMCIAFYTRSDYSMIRQYFGSVIGGNDYDNLAMAYLDKSTERGIVGEQKDYFIQEGARYLEKAIKINPLPAYDKLLAMVYYSRGLELAKQGELPQAIHEYSQSIEINPKYVDAYYNRGLALARQKNFTQALSDYNKDIEINPKDAQAYNNRAVIYYQLRKYDKAWADVHKAQGLGFVINPEIISALKTLSP